MSVVLKQSIRLQCQSSTYLINLRDECFDEHVSKNRFVKIVTTFRSWPSIVAVYRATLSFSSCNYNRQTLINKSSLRMASFHIIRYRTRHATESSVYGQKYLPWSLHRGPFITFTFQIWSTRRIHSRYCRKSFRAILSSQTTASMPRKYCQFHKKKLKTSE